MEALSEFTIPVQGLKLGEHLFDYRVDWKFFRHFENHAIEQGLFDVFVSFTKEVDHWLLRVRFNGTMDTACDRCLAPISLPVSGEQILLVKFDDSDDEVADDPDVMYVPRDISSWNIAQYIHETIVLAVPVRKVYECREEQEPPCDEDVLKRLESEEGSQPDDTAWDVLKNLDWQNN